MLTGHKQVWVYDQWLAFIRARLGLTQSQNYLKESEPRVNLGLLKMQEPQIRD